MREQSRNSLEESSVNLGRFLDIVQRSNDASQIKIKGISSESKEESFIAEKENKTPELLQIQKKPTKKQPTLNQKTVIESTSKGQNRFFKIKSKAVEANPPSYFPNNARLKTNFS